MQRPRSLPVPLVPCLLGLLCAAPALPGANAAFRGDSATTVEIVNHGSGTALRAFSGSDAQNYASFQAKTAVLAEAFNNGDPGDVHGVYAYADGYDGSSSAGDAYALYGRVHSANTGYGIWAGAWYNNDSYAGFFEGQVVVTGTLSAPSDARFKRDLRGVEGGLGKVLALKPNTYEMKVDEYRDSVNLSRGRKYGLVAQEVEQVLPELITEVSAPPRLTPEERRAGVRKNPVRFKSVDYLGLVSVLVSAVQEQQAQVEEQKAQIALLQKKLQHLETRR